MVDPLAQETQVSMEWRLPRESRHRGGQDCVLPSGAIPRVSQALNCPIASSRSYMTLIGSPRRSVRGKGPPESCDNACCTTGCGRIAGVMGPSESEGIPNPKAKDSMLTSHKPELVTMNPSLVQGSRQPALASATIDASRSKRGALGAFAGIRPRVSARTVRDCDSRARGPTGIRRFRVKSSILKDGGDVPDSLRLRRVVPRTRPV